MDDGGGDGAFEESPLLVQGIDQSGALGIEPVGDDGDRLVRFEQVLFLVQQGEGEIDPGLGGPVGMEGFDGNGLS